MRKALRGDRAPGQATAARCCWGGAASFKTAAAQQRTKCLAANFATSLPPWPSNTPKNPVLSWSTSRTTAWASSCAQRGGGNAHVTQRQGEKHGVGPGGGHCDCIRGARQPRGTAQLRAAPAGHNRGSAATAARRRAGGAHHVGAPALHRRNAPAEQIILALYRLLRGWGRFGWKGVGRGIRKARPVGLALSVAAARADRRWPGRMRAGIL